MPRASSPPRVWSFMAQSIAAQQARSLGDELDAPRAEYAALFSAIMYGTAQGRAAGSGPPPCWTTLRIRTRGS
jgi:hypothetical protein